MKIIHIFEESEILSELDLNGTGFIELLGIIEKCEKRNELKKIITNKENNGLIRAF